MNLPEGLTYDYAAAKADLAGIWELRQTCGDELGQDWRTPDFPDAESLLEAARTAPLKSHEAAHVLIHHPLADVRVLDAIWKRSFEMTERYPDDLMAQIDCVFSWTATERFLERAWRQMRPAIRFWVMANPKCSDRMLEAIVRGDDPQYARIAKSLLDIRDRHRTLDYAPDIF
ncbi:hypothetical protein [Arthrobacter mobilis]|uniref:Uncharacterized protein n=1 Tax=Arthrobacter mobilis TaxID=2724944 RepID=A0A7X6HGX1_9MICC|nr:hypothetical protein [Arthrobacter mobilis]NKX56009.1 hypothetical protein [Arthrobacter mobilis]